MKHWESAVKNIRYDPITGTYKYQEGRFDLNVSPIKEEYNVAKQDPKSSSSEFWTPLGQPRKAPPSK